MSMRWVVKMGLGARRRIGVPASTSTPRSHLGEGAEPADTVVAEETFQQEGKT